jgi:phosphoglycerate dehydrogenase-like enzyme
MDDIRVAVLDDYQQVAAGYADWSRLDATITFFSDHLDQHEVLVERLSPFQVIAAMRERTPFPRSLIEALPHLRLLVTTGMNNASIDLRAATDGGIAVCGTASPGRGTAELTFGLILALARDLIGETSSVRSGGWQTGVGRDLMGSTLGVIGLGKQGSAVARFGSAFGMDVIAWSQNLTADRASEVGVRLVSKDELLTASDYVTIHVRLSDRTRGLLGTAELARMKPTAFVINTSRGPIVDSEALLTAVRSGTIAGAALDVFDPEPLLPDDPFRHEPRILTTPHIGYVTDDTYRVFYTEVVEDIAAWMTGSPIRILNPTPS